LAAAVRALAAQSFGDFEAIVIDNGSADVSFAAAQSAAAGDDRVLFRRAEGARLFAEAPVPYGRHHRGVVGLPAMWGSRREAQFGRRASWRQIATVLTWNTIVDLRRTPRVRPISS
jgi:glycosyltransferase involved in cell wall biosynthesis